MKIAIVDDELLFRNYLKSSFDWNQMGLEICWEAKNGEEALEKLNQEVPDIMLVDINMPFMDGLELSARATESFSEVHIVLVTGQGEFEYARKAIKLGVKDYILKPFNKEELESAMKRIKLEIMKNREDLFFEGLSEDSKGCAFYPGSFYTDIIMDLRLQRKEALKEKLEQVFQDIRGKKLTADFIYGISSSLISACLSYVSECGKDIEDVFGKDFSPFNSMKSKKSIEALKAYTEGIFEKSLEYMMNNKKTSGDRIVEKAVEYINSHYHDEGLCLESICRHVYVNESYLRSLFRSKTGMTVTDYITNVRMGKAKELIEKGGLKFSELCLRIGYTDQAYFSRCFKKYFGISPSEYENTLK